MSDVIDHHAGVRILPVSHGYVGKCSCGWEAFEGTGTEEFAWDDAEEHVQGKLTKKYVVKTYGDKGLMLVGRPMTLETARNCADMANAWWIENGSPTRDIVEEY